MIPDWIRWGINISTVFVAWVTIQSWLDPIEQHMWAEPEMLNAVGAYTIPACFGIIVYFIIRHYEQKELSSLKNNKT